MPPVVPYFFSWLGFFPTKNPSFYPFFIREQLSGETAHYVVSLVRVHQHSLSAISNLFYLDPSSPIDLNPTF